MLRLLLCSALLCLSGAALGGPVVIAHRGASAYLPEHTLAAYEAAIDMGADFIEPDLVLSKDGHLIARHEIYLSATTDVENRDAFAGRKRQLGDTVDWFVADFTLDEIRSLKAKQRYQRRSTEHDGRYGIPTLQEVVLLVKRKQEETGKTIGLYPELKFPAYFRGLGFDMGERLLAELARQPLEKVYIQSFDPVVLKELNEKTDLPLVMLLSSSEDRPALKEVAVYADGIGALKWMLIKQNGDDSGFVADAHANGLFVHAWTFQDDRLPALFDSPESELKHFLGLGIDGFFTDNPDTGVRVRNRLGSDPIH